MTMSYDFQVTIEAESEEEAKAKFTSTPLEKFGDYQFKSFYKTVRNIKLDTENRLSLSQEIIDKISLNTKVYLEYLKDESIILRNVVDSKEESKIKMDDTEISFEQLDQDQTEISEKLDYEKIKTLDIKNSKKQNTILVEIYKDINLAKLKTNKIRNLGLFYEENEEGVKVFAGPFLKSDINLKLDFLIKNGYLNAKKTP